MDGPIDDDMKDLKGFGDEASADSFEDEEDDF